MNGERWPGKKWLGKQQSRSVRNILYNTKLNHMQMLETDICYYCNEIGSLIHVYWECPSAQTLWKGLAKWVEEIFGYPIKLNKGNCLINMCSTQLSNFEKTDIARLLNITTCHYIHINLCDKSVPTVKGLIGSRKNLYSTEKNIYTKRGKLPQFNERWGVATTTL